MGEVKNYIGKKEKNNFVLGLCGQNMVYSLIGAQFFNYFLTDIALFPAIVVSVLLIAMKIWDGVNDPIVGSYIDKHSFKNGEKMRPFLKYTPLPVGVFTVLLFLVFSTNEDLLWLRIAYFVIMYICWDLAYTVQDVCIWGITAAVSPNSSERDRFVQWARTIGSCVYLSLSTVIPMVLEMIANAKGVSMAFVTFVFALIFGLGGAMISYRCSYAQERVQVNQQEQQGSMVESFALLFKNKMLLLVTLANLFGALGFGASMVTYFFKYEIPADFLGGSGIIGALGLSTIYFIITGLPGFIGMVCADKLKKLLGGYVNVLILIQVTNIIVRVIAFFVGFEGKNLWISMIIIGIGSIPSGAASIAQTSIFCDSIDYMEWKTGKRTEGITFSMQTSFTKISSGITAGLASFALFLLGYKAVDNAEIYVGTQTAAFDTWIWFLVILTPAIASVFYIIPLLFVRYTKEKRAIVESDLIARRAGKPESGLSPYILKNKYRRKNMTPQKAIEYCLDKKGAYEDYPFGLDITIIKVKGKIFAQFFQLDGKDMATFNCDRLTGEFYRQQYPDIVVRGYHCPPVQQPYFNTLPMDNTLSDDVIAEMIEHSYAYVVSKLPKYVQKELTDYD